MVVVLNIIHNWVARRIKTPSVMSHKWLELFSYRNTPANRAATPPGAQIIEKEYIQLFKRHYTSCCLLISLKRHLSLYLHVALAILRLGSDPADLWKFKQIYSKKRSFLALNPYFSQQKWCYKKHHALYDYRFRLLP